MPWCEECAKYWAPSAMAVDGSCPACGRAVEVAATAANVNVRKLAGGESERAPWHFKLMMGLLALYFVWRVIDLFR